MWNFAQTNRDQPTSSALKGGASGLIFYAKKIFYFESHIVNHFNHSNQKFHEKTKILFSCIITIGSWLLYLRRGCKQKFETHDRQAKITKSFLPGVDGLWPFIRKKRKDKNEQKHFPTTRFLLFIENN